MRPHVLCIGLALLLTLAMAMPAEASWLRPGNRVQNGGFEAGLAGWLMPSGGSPNVQLVAISDPAPCEGTQAIAVNNHASGGFVYQPLATADAPADTGVKAPPTVTPAPLLQFQANVFGGLGGTGSQVVRVLDAWPLGVTPLVEVRLSATGVSYRAYGSDWGSASMTSGVCHDIKIKLEQDEVTGEIFAVLNIDKVKRAAVVVTDPDFAAEGWGIIQVGDVGLDSREGAAPDVLYDDIFFAGHQVFI